MTTNEEKNMEQTQEIERPHEGEVIDRNQRGREARDSSWHYRPDVDIVETDENYRIVADVPGADREAIDIAFEDQVLTLDVKVKPRYPERNEFASREFGVGNYHRRFRIGDDVDVEKIDAEYSQGVLNVVLPKKHTAKRRTIQVKAG